MDRDEKVLRWYELACQHLFNDDRLLAERTNLFLLSSSILFLGFVTLVCYAKMPFFEYFLPIIGMILSIMHFRNAQYSSEALGYWHEQIVRKIEKEEGWDNKYTKFSDTNIFSEGIALRLGFSEYFEKLNCFKHLIGKRRGVPSNAWKLWLPIVVFLVWLAALLEHFFSIDAFLKSLCFQICNYFS